MTTADLSVSVSTTTRQADTSVVAGDTARFDAATEARLAGIDRNATELVDEHRPQNTRDSYASDWKAWERFTAASGRPLLAVRSGTLVLFVEWCRLQPAQGGQGEARHGVARPSRAGTGAVGRTLRAERAGDRRPGTRKSCQTSPQVRLHTRLQPLWPRASWHQAARPLE